MNLTRKNETGARRIRMNKNGRHRKSNPGLLGSWKKGTIRERKPVRDAGKVKLQWKKDLLPSGQMGFWNKGETRTKK